MVGAPPLILSQKANLWDGLGNLPSDGPQHSAMIQEPVSVEAPGPVNMTDFDLGEEFAIEQWVYVTDASPPRIFFDRGDYAFIQMYNMPLFMLNRDTQTMLGMGGVGFTETVNHVVITGKPQGAGYLYVMYVNGAVYDTLNYSDPIDQSGNSGSFKMFESLPDLSFSSDFVWIDNLAFYDRALPLSEIQDHYDIGTSPYEPEDDPEPSPPDPAEGADIQPTPAGLLPTSMAGDQVVFKRGSTCYRIMHFKEQEQIWMAAATGTSPCDNLKSETGVMRGPNQEITGAPFTSSNQLYDPVLDSILTDSYPSDLSFLLIAENVTPVQPNRPVFSYYDVRESALTLDTNAQLGTSNPIYIGDSGLEIPLDIAEIRADYKVESKTVKVSDRTFSQSFFLAQVCEPVS